MDYYAVTQHNTVLRKNYNRSRLVVLATRSLAIKMCIQQSQLDVKAEMKACHVPHMDTFQETESAGGYLAVLNQPTRNKQVWK